MENTFHCKLRGRNFKIEGNHFFLRQLQGMTVPLQFPNRSRLYFFIVPSTFQLCTPITWSLSKCLILGGASLHRRLFLTLCGMEECQDGPIPLGRHGQDSSASLLQGQSTGTLSYEDGCSQAISTFGTDLTLISSDQTSLMPVHESDGPG